jgi:hypothetical protein
MKTMIPYILLLCFAGMYGCRQKVNEPTQARARIVFRFETDSAGNIQDENVRRQLKDLAIRVSKNADRVMLYSYTEKMSSSDTAVQIATLQAYAAKNWMYKYASERIYYSVGIDARGFENPVEPNAPESKMNRRIEVEFIE